MASRQPDLILGTAGHIDHGKSALVLALTGTDPDRLAEEKQRGITIKLGFAQLQLADGRMMGVVDVPGHERFVKQMIAGATGVDVALLVIAADDGVMPQTVEHLAVLQTLGVGACVVALTKTDLVDADWIEFMEGEVAGFLTGTAYEGCDIVAVSSKTGEGVDELKAAIGRACAKAHHRAQGAAARLPIDRAFTIKGAGTVVTGTLWSGTVAPGDEVETLPGGTTHRVRSVQVHNEPVERAQAGMRVALNLADASTEEVRAGSFLCTPGAVEPTDRFDCLLTFLDTAKRSKPLETGARMHIAHGTREVLGRVLLCDGRERLGPNESAYAQVRLEEPLPLCSGDRFIMRTYSPVQVAGGGMVLLAHPRRRTNLDEAMRNLLGSLAAGDFDQAVQLAVEAQTAPISSAKLCRFIGADRERVDGALDACLNAGSLKALGAVGEARHFAAESLIRKLASSIDRTLIGFHSDNPTEAGMAKEALRRKCFPNMSMSCFDVLVGQLAESGAVVARDGLVGHPGAQGSARQALDNAADKLARLLADQGMAPETLPYLAEHAGLAPHMAGKAASELVKAGRAYRVSNDLLFDAATIERAKAAVAHHLESGGEGSAAALKEVMGTSRKFAMPLLERFDAEGFTRRVGDMRVLC